MNKFKLIFFPFYRKGLAFKAAKFLRDKEFQVSGYPSYLWSLWFVYPPNSQICTVLSGASDLDLIMFAKAEGFGDF